MNDTKNSNSNNPFKFYKKIPLKMNDILKINPFQFYKRNPFKMHRHKKSKLRIFRKKASQA